MSMSLSLYPFAFFFVASQLRPHFSDLVLRCVAYLQHMRSVSLVLLHSEHSSHPRKKPLLFWIPSFADFAALAAGSVAALSRVQVLLLSVCLSIRMSVGSIVWCDHANDAFELYSTYSPGR